MMRVIARTTNVSCATDLAVSAASGRAQGTPGDVVRITVIGFKGDVEVRLHFGARWRQRGSNAVGLKRRRIAEGAWIGVGSMLLRRARGASIQIHLGRREHSLCIQRRGMATNVCRGHSLGERSTPYAGDVVKGL